MSGWQRLVGTGTEARRVANPGIVAVALLLALCWLYLGASALADGRAVQGLGRVSVTERV